MRFIFRWIFRLALLLVVSGIAAVLLKDTLLKSYVEKRWRSQTGLDVRMGDFELNLLNPVVHFENFIFYNAAEFGGSPCMHLGEVYAEYYPNALIRQKLRLKLVRLDVREIHIVQTSDGKNNLPQIQSIIRKGLANNVAGLEFAGIETLNLSVGKARITQLGKTQKTREFSIGIQNEIIKDIQSTDGIASILLKILKQRVLIL
jgi:hypothetical protein